MIGKLYRIRFGSLCPSAIIHKPCVLSSRAFTKSGQVHLEAFTTPQIRGRIRRNCVPYLSIETPAAGSLSFCRSSRGSCWTGRGISRSTMVTCTLSPCSSRYGQHGAKEREYDAQKYAEKLIFLPIHPQRMARAAGAGRACSPVGLRQLHERLRHDSGPDLRQYPHPYDRGYHGHCDHSWQRQRRDHHHR